VRLSTSTNILDYVPDKREPVPVEECLRRCSQAGYKVMDMNFCDQSGEGRPLTKDNWKDWVNKVGEAAQKYHIMFSQSHTLFYNVCDHSIKEREDYEELVRRAIIGSGMLGVKWIVIHAGTVNEQGYSFRESMKRNHEYFLPHIELAQKYNCGIAIENLPENDRKNREFAAAVEELLELVDSFDDSSVGICWDFGHAHLTDENQEKSLRRIGHRLKATHVADNHGNFDEHLAPFYGNIDWYPLMKVLTEINYAGDFTFEIHSFMRKFPDALRDHLLVHTYDLGQYLISKA
jgi:sugar phosphate isomerase/epimerase